MIMSLRATVGVRTVFLALGAVNGDPAYHARSYPPFLILKAILLPDLHQ